MKTRDRPYVAVHRLAPAVAAVLIGVLLTTHGPAGGASAAAPRDRAQTVVEADGPYFGGVGVPVIMTASVASPPLGGYAVEWSFGDGLSSSGAVVSHGYGVAATYPVVARVYDVTHTVVASDSSTAYISAVDAGGPYTGSPDGPISLHATIMNPPPAPFSLHWEFGDGASADGDTVTHSYSTVGVYTALLKLVYGGAIITQDAAAVTIATATGTSIEAGGPYTGSAGTPIVFTAIVLNAPPGYSVGWTFGDGMSATGSVISHTYMAPGVYPVVASVYQGGLVLAVDGASAVVTGTTTTVEAGGPYGGVAGSPVAFSATVNNPPAGYMIVWTFGDGASAPGGYVKHTFAAAGTYPVTAAVYLGTTVVASDSTVATIAAVAPPAIEANGPYSGVSGTAISFTATVANPPPTYAVTWAFGDGSSAGGASTSHVYTAPGSYTAIATLYSGGVAVLSDSATVTITPPPPSGPSATYPAGWNIVAGPAGMVFAQASGPLYTYQAGDTNYEVVTNTVGVTSGRGYWAYFPAPTTVTLSGAGAASATIAAPAGQWVMVGNPSPLATATVRGADTVVRWDTNAGGYMPVITLAPGQGAWAISVNGAVISVGP